MASTLARIPLGRGGLADGPQVACVFDERRAEPQADALGVGPVCERDRLRRHRTLR